MSEKTLPQSEAEEPCTSYSAFSKTQKRIIVLLVAFAGMFSPLSSFIYYPAIHSIAVDLGVTITLVNLTVTSYMVVSGVTPAIVGNLADVMGRRPIYLATLFVYFAANIALALQRSYPALLCLRMLQSFGGSGTIAIAYGVVSDIATPAERGWFVGAVLCGPNIAPSLGPILGGALAGDPGWPWIFWVLTMLSGFCLAALFVLLPETARAIVGTGGIATSNILQHSWSMCLGRTRLSKQSGCVSQPNRLQLSNPLRCLSVLKRRDTLLITAINGIYYATYCCVQASLALLVIELYHLKEIQAGLIYLPFGVGCLVASVLSGKIMDKDYRKTAKEHNFPIDRVRGDDLTKFHIEQARFRSGWIFLAVTIATLVAYGWTIGNRVNIAVPLVLQLFMGASITSLFNMCGTLLTDLNPSNPASAQASSNIVRCGLSAAGLAALQEMLDNIGAGWTFTVFAGLCLLTTPMIFAEMKWGLKWRAARQENLELNSSGQAN